MEKDIREKQTVRVEKEGQEKGKPLIPIGSKNEKPAKDRNGRRGGKSEISTALREVARFAKRWPRKPGKAVEHRQKKVSTHRGSGAEYVWEGRRDSTPSGGELIKDIVTAGKQSS